MKLNFQNILELINEPSSDLNLSNIGLAAFLEVPEQLNQFCQALLLIKDRLKTLNLSSNNIGSCNTNIYVWRTSGKWAGQGLYTC